MRTMTRQGRKTLDSVIATTSISSVSVGTGSKSFVTFDYLSLVVGSPVLIVSAAGPTTDWMYGTISAILGLNVTVAVTVVAGSGTHSDWEIALSGLRGADGVIGVDGAPGADGAAGPPGADGATGPAGASGTIIALCGGFTPDASGGDAFEAVVPYDTDGTSVVVWNITRCTFRVAIPSTVSSQSVVIQKSSASGAFSPTTVTTLTLTAGSYEISDTVSLGTVSSGHKLRFSIPSLTDAAGWSIEVQLGR